MFALILATQVGLWQTPSLPTQKFFPLPPAGSLFVTESGHPVKPNEIFPHELTLTETTPDGYSHFLVNGKQKVKSNAVKLFDHDVLRPLQSSPVLKELKEKYQGKKIWLYGRPDTIRYSQGLNKALFSSLVEIRNQSVEHVFQISPYDPAKVYAEPVKSSEFIDDLGNYTFIVVFSGKRGQTLPFEEKGFSSNGNLDYDDGSFCDPYTKDFCQPLLAYEALPDMNNVFSLTPPKPHDIKAIQKFIRYNGEWIYGDELKFPLTRVQTAWRYGWPEQGRPHNDLLKADRFDYWDETIIFEKGRITEIYQGLPH